MNEKVLKNFMDLTNVKHMAAQLLGQSANPMDQFDSQYMKAMAESDERIITCIKEGKPFLHSWYFNAPELYTAMDLDWYNCALPAVFDISVKGPSVFEETDKIPLDHDICTLQRLMLRSVEADLAPVPTISVQGLTPCDGLGLFHEAIRQYPGWRDIPILEIDPPYWEDEASVRYYAEEIKRMACGLAALTGKKLDVDHLRGVLEESNKQYELWMEYNELRRMKPCPHPSFSGDKIFNITQNIALTVGHPRGTKLIQDLLDDEMEMVRKNKGWVEDEKIRLYWADIQPIWSAELSQWLEKECNANVVMDVYGYCPYAFIDTSTEEAMFDGLARRYLIETPMIRQSRGSVETSINDIIKVVKLYDIDCVIGPGHMGHKESAGCSGILREVCREIGVRFLFLESDSFDPRYTPMDKLKERFLQFFTTMGI